jgi:hypothetical protein
VRENGETTENCLQGARHMEGVRVNTDQHTLAWLNLVQSPITVLTLTDERLKTSITALAELKLSTVYRENKVYKHYHRNIP